MLVERDGRHVIAALVFYLIELLVGGLKQLLWGVIQFGYLCGDTDTEAKPLVNF